MPAQPRRPLLTRRRVLGAGAAVLVVPPAAGVTTLRLQDKPLPRVAEPDPVLVGGWLLDAGDLEADDPEADGGA